MVIGNMGVVVVGIVFTLLLLFHYLINQLKKPKNFPPGPQWLPYFGTHFYLSQLVKTLGGLHLALTYMAQKYKTKVVGFKLGRELMVSVHGYELIKEVYLREEFEGRPDNFFFKLRNFGRSHSGITGNDGALWKTNRTFVMRHFRSKGFSRLPLETMVRNEVANMVQILENQPSSVQVSKFVAPAVLNILWTFLNGKPISREETVLNELLELFERRAKLFDVTGGPMNYYPWLRFVAPNWSGYNLVQKINAKLKAVILTTINEHYETWYEARDDDLIYSYITEMKKNPDFCEGELTTICLDIFLAGTQVTSSSVEMVFSTMILYPHIKNKVIDEIDKMVDKTAMLDYHTSKKLPYTMAVLMETQRMYHITPIGGPRRTLRDTTIGGFFIPKDTTVLLDLYAMNHDPTIWEDPDDFRPERFLDKDGEFVNLELFIPFGLGKRKCPGDVLGKQCFFYFFVEIMRKFDIELAEDSPPVKGKVSVGITLKGEKYSARFLQR